MRWSLVLRCFFPVSILKGFDTSAGANDSNWSRKWIILIDSGKLVDMSDIFIKSFLFLKYFFQSTSYLLNFWKSVTLEGLTYIMSCVSWKLSSVVLYQNENANRKEALNPENSKWFSRYLLWWILPRYLT